MTLKESLHQQFAIPVLRESRLDHLEHIARAVVAGGMKIVEITLMSDGAYSVIQKLSQEKGVIIGAGTVLTTEQAQKAIEAGAQFLVSPGLNEEAVNFSQKQSVPFIPGALTPSEVMAAQRLGCDLVKVFPISSVGGVSYLNSLKAPFSGMSFMATGGISFSDIPQFVKNGCHSIGLGNNLTPIELVNAQNWNGIAQLAKQYLEAVHQARH